MKTMHLHIDDAGRNGEQEIAVEQAGSNTIKYFAFTSADLDKTGQFLTAKFWRSHGYTGRLVISDHTLGEIYEITVK